MVLSKAWWVGVSAEKIEDYVATTGREKGFQAEGF